MSSIRSRLTLLAFTAALPCLVSPAFAADRSPGGTAASASTLAASTAPAGAPTTRPASAADLTASATGAAAPEAPQGLGIGSSDRGSRASEFLRMVVETGHYRCELSRDVTIRSISQDRQTMVISWLGTDHTLNAVGTSTGAMRYENSASGLVWLVILGKSMLLDSKKGQQLANECRL